MADGILKEYLVRLGLQDNMTERLNNSLDNAGRKAAKFTGSFGKQFLFAGVAVATMAAGAGLALGRLVGHLAQADDELTKFAKDMDLTREEAYKTKSAMDVLGKSMDDIKADPKLLAQFEELRANMENIKIPDLSPGLDRVRSITTEFLKLKQTAMAGLQWVGHYLFKYVDRPLQEVGKTLGGINESLRKNLPQWGEKIGRALSWIVRLGTTVIRGAELVFKAIKRVFDMIPGQVKVAMGAFAALALFIKAGPIGKLITIIMLALALLDDFFTYLDGGESLLGGFWQKLIDVWNMLNKQGGAIEKLKEGFQKAMAAIGKGIDNAIAWTRNFWNQLRECNAINNFREAFSKVGRAIGNIFTALKGAAAALFSGMLDGSDKVTLFLVWLISDAIPKTIGLVADIAGTVALFIQKLNELGLTKPLILTIVGAFAAFKTVKFVTGFVDGVTKSVLGATKTIEGLKNAQGPISSLVSAFSGLKKAVAGYTATVWKSVAAAAASAKAKLVEKAETLYLHALIAKDAVVRGLSTAAQWAQTAATTAWNAAAGIATAVTTAFGAAVAFLTSPIGLVILAIVALIAIVVLLIKNWDKVKEFFIRLWAKIKEVFSGVGSWFKDKFTQAKESVINAFVSVADWFAGIWQKIKDTFAGGDGFFSQIAGTWFRGIEAAFGIIVAWFKMIWENIKLVFSVVKSVLSGDFQGAYDAIVQIWNNITGFFSTLAGKLKGVFQPFVDWILEKFGKIGEFVGGVVDKISGIFGGGDDKPKPKPTPTPSTGHAEGVISTSEHAARISEGDQAEAVIPLTKPSRAKQMLRQAVSFLGMPGDSIDGQQAAPVFEKMKAFIDQASASMQQMNQLATAGAVTGAANSSSIVNDNRQFDMSSKIIVNDSSGDPQATARAVDHMQELRTRNMKGAIQ